jgi:hypothetical protein
MHTGQVLGQHQHVRDSVRRYTISPLLGALLGAGYGWLFSADLGNVAVPIGVLWPFPATATWILGYFVLKWARVRHPGATAGWGVCISMGLTFIVVQGEPKPGWWLALVGVVAFSIGAVFAD